uniref:hypothetical protein n=1 Tax=Aeromonas hydrophila TaxID=644 RepID=UPI000A95F08D|nr:hypothetical protein [Aeromonas hydrophila]
MRLPNPYSLEEILSKLRHVLTTASKKDALTLLEKAVTKARDDWRYAKQFEETLLQGSTIEIRECLSCFGDYVERSRDAPPYYPHHDAVNGIVRSTPSCSMPLTQKPLRRMNNTSIPKPGSSMPAP